MSTGRSKCEASAGHRVIQYQTGGSKCEIRGWSKCENRLRHESCFSSKLCPKCESVTIYIYIYIYHIHIYIDAFNLFGGAQFPSFPHCWSPSSFWGIRCHVVQNCCTHDLGWHNLDGYQNTAWFQVTCFKHMSNVNPTCLLIQYDTMKIWQHDQWQFEQCLKPSIVYLLVLDGQKLNPLDGRKVNPWFATVRQILDRIIHCHSILSTFINHIQ